MEMHQLRYFLAVARLGNFSRAAEECHVAQPSLSQQIQKLEEELGESLIERTPRLARLTSAGVLLVPRARQILETAELARQEIGEMEGQVRGRIAVGALPTIAPYYLPELIQSFQRAYPAVELVVHEETTAQLLRGVEDKELDLAVVSDIETSARLTAEALFHEELYLCLPARHPLIRQKKVTAKDLHSERFILMQEGHCLGAQAQQFCHTKGFRPQISCRSAQIATIQAMVQSGMGISLIPHMARQANSSKGIVYRSLNGVRPQREILLVRAAQRKLSAAAEAFRALVRERV